ncbi:MAG: lipid A deacylase LpxR family protein [Syntrophales bacterium]
MPTFNLWFFSVKVFRGIKKKTFLLFALLITLFLLPQQGRAGEEAGRYGTLTLCVENDLFSLDDYDRYYTSGTKISWISRDVSDYGEIVKAPSWMQRLLEWMPFVNDPGEQRSVSLSLAQDIYTPDDKWRSALMPNDRPYAGLAYLGMGLHSKNESQMDTLEFDIGIVGRHSYAEDFQKEIHILIKDVDPKGWSNQLHDEPLVNIYGERRWKALKSATFREVGFDFIPHAGMAAGNAYTGINLGGQLRFGWNIPNNFGTFMIRPGTDGNVSGDDDRSFARRFPRFGIHLFLAVDGKFVARNIALDGNTFRDSHSIDKKPFVADLVGGIGMNIRRFKFAYSYVYRTKEFDTQKKEQQFGSISLSFAF